jgi:hypothetical protein
MLDIPDSLADVLHREAVRNGFKRENPRKAWTQSEIKDAIRYAIDKRLPA